MDINEAASVLGITIFDVQSYVDNGSLVVEHRVERTDRTTYRILTQSVITFAEKRDAETVDDVLAKAVMDYQQAMKVLQVSDSVLDKIISEKKITALNVTPKAEYKTMQVVTASVKAYLSQRTVLLGKFTSSLEEAGNLLGVSRERVRQLIHEGKIDAIDVSTNGDTHSRWMVSRDSIQGRVEGLRLPGAG